MKKFLLPFLLIAFFTNTLGQSIAQSLISFGSTWKYLDNGTDQGTAWRAIAFDDAAWQSGNGKFGYGITDATTTISYGPKAVKKYITTYFRNAISLNPSFYSSFTVNLKRDDGVIVYINGTEIYRNNLPSGSVNYATLASDATDDGYVPQTFTVNSSAFTNGVNLIAVEVHQSKANTPDMAFDLELIGNLISQGDQTPPAVSSINRQSPLSQSTNATTFTYRATFSEKVNGVDYTDFTLSTLSGPVTGTLNNQSVAAVGTSGTAFDVTVNSVAGSGTLRLDLNSSGTGITDVAGNAITSGFTSGQTYIVDQASPVLTSVAIASNNSNTSLAKPGNTVTLSFTASKAINTPTVTIATRGVTATAGSNNSFTAAYTMAASDVESTVPFTINFSDLSGNPGTQVSSTSNGSSVLFDKTLPAVVSINRQSPLSQSTNASSLTYRVIFSEKANGVDYTDFTLSQLAGAVTGTLNNQSVTAVGSAGTTYDVTTSSVTGSGTVRLDLNGTGTGITDDAGNAITSGFTTGQTYIVGQTTTLVANWKMDEGSGITLTDASTYANNATTTGNPTWVSGVKGQALKLNGTSQYATAPNNASLNITGAITLAAWIKPEKLATQYIIKKAINGTTNGYELSLSNTGVVLFRFNQASSADTYRLNSLASYPVDGVTWMHIAATYDGSVIKIYINGVLNSSKILTAPPSITANTLSLGIGAQSDGASKFQGAIDEAYVYNTALNASEIEGLGLNLALTRGPYLNLATQNTIILRWRTNIATDSKVNFGTLAGSLSNSISDATVTTEHIVQLNGLAGNIKYYYSIGSSQQTLQGDANNYFKTLPTTGSKQKIRILAMGDMGNNSSTQKSVRDAYLNYNAGKYTDIWMLLGDNAYVNGTDSEFQANWFNVYQQNLTKNHVIWPSPGNHDYANSSARQADHLIAYYDMFSLPKNAEAGGLNSGTEGYYSYDYGNTHFVSLDSYGWETGSTRLYDTTGPQATWLKQDLAANHQQWTVVYFHHPPYSKASQNSDTDPEETKVRENVVRILERYKVDLVLNGHAHYYSRSFLLNGHYGISTSFDTSMYALSASSARYDGSSNSSPYIKNSTATRNGIVYTVVGSSGSVGSPVAGFPHPAMYYSNVTNGGSMVLEIDDNRLDAKWICSDGIIRDNFTMMKEVNKTIDTTISTGTSITLTASWPGNYMWANGATTRSLTVSPTKDTTYIVRDSLNYLRDSFKIKVNGQPIPLSINATSGAILCNGGNTSITAAATGGSSPYTYSLDGVTYQSASTFAGKTAGTYTLYVKDVTLATANTNITLKQPTVLSATSNASPATILCNGSSAVVAVNATGGTIPYNGTGNFTVNAGTYNYTVTDANGCSSITTITINQPAAISVSVSGTAVSSYGGTTTITINATGGTGAYSYSLNGGTFQTSNIFPNVNAGSYTATVKDANNCTSSLSFTVTQPPAPSLVGHWKMDESTGTSIIDASDYSNNGTTIGNPVWVTGAIGQALHLNGSSQYVSVLNSTSLNITNSITLSAWIKPEKVGTQYIIKKATLNSIDGYELSLAVDGTVFFRINQKTSQNTYRVNSTVLYPTNGTTWMHVAGTYNGSVMKFYVNGVLNATISPNNPPAIKTNTLILAIGAQSDGISKFQGDIDDARVYNVALSDADIQGLFNPPSAPVTQVKAGLINSDKLPETMISDSLQVYPNPFSSRATIRFVTPERGNYSVSLYDTKGAKISVLKLGNTIIEGEQNSVEINAYKLSNGIYFIRLQTKKFVRTLKLILRD